MMNRFASFRLALVIFSSIPGAFPSFITAQEPTDFFSGNGSFEYGEMHGGVINLFGCNPYSDDDCPYNGRRSFSQRVDGWFITGSAAWNNHSPQDGNGYLGLQASGGRSHLNSSATFHGYDLTDPSLIKHTPFTIGDLYELSFWAAGGTGTVNRLRVSINMEGGGATEESFLFPGGYTPEEVRTDIDWQRYAIQFVATGETLSVSFSPGSAALWYEARSSVYLDNVSLTRVPEPSGAVLVLLGSALFTLRRSRSTRASA